MTDLAPVLARYARFAAEEAPGRSALYAAWAETVLERPEVAAVLARIPDTHRQPPLVFAVSRMLGAAEDTGWGDWVLANADALVAECGRRSIQTNEPLRCAALLPALSLVAGPIALLEIGASAGLCLYPDRYSYRYTDAAGAIHAVDPDDGVSSVVLDAGWRGAPPELRMPEVVWRAGIDLQPRDPRDAADRSWLTGLVWPGEQGRRERIDAALAIAAAEPSLLRAGDAAEPGALVELVAAAPADATLVVTTPGVLAHVPRLRRHAVMDAARRAGRWITLDAPGLHDGWDAPIAEDWPDGRFALALDGEVLAAVDPLGSFVEWRRDRRTRLG